jgi:hypothetical protein
VEKIFEFDKEHIPILAMSWRAYNSNQLCKECNRLVKEDKRIEK